MGVGHIYMNISTPFPSVNYRCMILIVVRNHWRTLSCYPTRNNFSSYFLINFSRMILLRYWGSIWVQVGLGFSKTWTYKSLTCPNFTRFRMRILYGNTPFRKILHTKWCLISIFVVFRFPFCWCFTAAICSKMWENHPRCLRKSRMCGEECLVCSFQKIFLKHECDTNIGSVLPRLWSLCMYSVFNCGLGERQNYIEYVIWRCCVFFRSCRFHDCCYNSRFHILYRLFCSNYGES
jgi:hypothetical protein